MTRLLRIEFPGAVYHVTSRGNARQAIFLGEEDKSKFLEVLLKDIAEHLGVHYATISRAIKRAEQRNK